VIVLDSTFLLLFLNDKVQVPKDPATGKPYEKARERIEYLIEQLSDARTPVLVPTPILAEVLVRAGGATGEYLTKVRGVPGFRVGNFDQRAAVEVAVMTGAALSAGKKRGAARDDAPWQKIKIDRQIIAIAKTEGARRLYSMDRDLRSLAQANGLKAIDLDELPLPPLKAQSDMFEPDSGK
jgi:predicted nucleic acid-binding protein